MSNLSNQTSQKLPSIYEDEVEFEDILDEEEYEEESIKENANVSPYANKIAIPLLEYSGELAVALLLISWTPELKNYEVLRTDDQEIIEQCGMQINQTKTFDLERKIFYRQTGMCLSGFPSNVGIAGLIYYFYGKQALKNKYPFINNITDPTDEKFLFNKLYKCIIEPLDLRQECDISRLANTLNPTDDPDPYVKQEAIQQMMNLIEEQIEQRVKWINNTMMNSRAYIRKALDDRTKVLQTGEILYMSHFCPIFLHKDIIDPDETKKQPCKYIVMGRVTGDAIVHTFSWRQNYKRLGLRGKSGDQLTGLLQNITGTGWVHPNGSLAEWNSLANALEFSKQMLKSSEKA